MLFLVPVHCKIEENSICVLQSIHVTQSKTVFSFCIPSILRFHTNKHRNIVFSHASFTKATLETTIGNENASLWSLVKPTGCVLEGARSMVANRLATSGGEWSQIFTTFNSGT